MAIWKLTSNQKKEDVKLELEERKITNTNPDTKIYPKAKNKETIIFYLHFYGLKTVQLG